MERVLFSYDKPSSNMIYFTGIDLDYCGYYNKTLYTFPINYKRAKRYKLPIKNIEELYNDIPSEIEVPISDLKARTYSMLSKKAKIIDISEKLLEIRMKKNRKELSYIRKANKFALEILQEIREEIKKPIREIELYSIIMKKIYEKNLKPAFDPIVANWKNAKEPHHFADNSIIDSVALIDFGVEYERYKSDITDMILINPKPSQLEYYHKIKSYFDFFVEKIYSGMEAKDLDEIYSQKYGKKLPPHSIGHGIGLDIHEFPEIRKNSKHILKDVAITIEPAFYSSFGIRYERDLIITKKVEILDI